MEERTELLPLSSHPACDTIAQVDIAPRNGDPLPAEKVDGDVVKLSSERSFAETSSPSDVPGGQLEPEGIPIERFRHGNLDNLRVVLITLLVLQHAVLVTVATSPDCFKLHKTAPKSFASLTLFVTFTRTVVVGILFFISGFASWSNAALESTSVLHFALWKTWRTGLEAGGYYLSILAVRHLYGPAPESGPYYATQAGRNALMHGPLFYVVFVLLLDYILVIVRVSRRFIWRAKRSRVSIISTPNQYFFVNLGAYIVLQFIMSIRAKGIVRPAGKLRAWLYLADSTELYAPFLYIITYITGLYFIPLHEISFKCTPPKRWTGLFFHFLAVLMPLRTLYRDLPDVIPQYLDIRVAPPLGFFDSGIKDPKNFGTKYFVLWTSWTLWILPPTIIGSFYVIPFLKKPFSAWKRQAYIQTHIHMIFVIGIARGAGWIDNLLWRCLYVGTGAVVCGWLAVLVPVAAMRFIGEAWDSCCSAIALAETDQEEV